MSLTTATPATTTTEPAREGWAEVAAELHRIADALATVRGDGLARLHVELKISTNLCGQEPDVCAVKAATVDAVALAVLGEPGAIVETGPAHDWVYHKAEATGGAVNVVVFELIADPLVQETQSELERMRAELAELRAERNRAVKALADGI